MILRSFSYRRLLLVLVAALAAAGVLVVVSTLSARSARHAPDRRPLILLLHGRGQLGRDTASVRAEWQDALEAGIWTLTKRPLVGPGDVRLVWYADVLDPAASTQGCDATESRQHHQRSGGGGQDDGDVLGLLLGVTSTLFTSLYESMPEDGRHSMRALIGDVLYLGDRGRRCAVDRRLESALTRAAGESRPVVLVAHSFGSLVAYSYLRENRPRERATQAATPTIHRFVTLGSMLGIPELQELLLGRVGPLSLPADVRSWVNVRHAHDPFAAPLADTASRRRGGATVREVLIRGDPGDPHDILAYLREPATARAIGWAWCDAFEGARPAACSDIQRDVP